MDLFFILIPLIWLFVLGGGGYLAYRFLRTYERRSLPTADDALEERVRALEESLERTESQLAQVTEAQQFTQQLLASRNQAPGNPELRE